MRSIFEQLESDPLSNTVSAKIGDDERTFEFLDVIMLEGRHYAVLAEKGGYDAEVFLIENPFSESENLLPVVGSLAETVFDIYMDKNDD